ncbi:unnamed protein product, partial [Didymodactylos carnosus]
MLKPGGHMNMSYLSETICQKQVTIIYTGPTIIRMLCDYFLLVNNDVDSISRIKTLRNILLAGELSKPKHLSTLGKYLYPSTNVYILYGASEFLISIINNIKNIHDLRNSTTVIPLGRPLINYEVFILNDKMQPVEKDEIGE